MTTSSMPAPKSAEEIAAEAIIKASTPVTPKAAPASNAPGIVKRTNAYYIDPRAISRQEGFNPRFEFGEIEELAKSIKANGLLQPIRVKKTDVAGQFVLIDGDRRFTAIELIMKKEPTYFDATGVHAIVVDKSQDDLTSLFQMFESNTGLAFKPLEEAAAYKRMRDAGLTIAQICQRVGRKQVHVVATLALLDADDEVKQAVKDGKVTGTTAKKIAVSARGDKAKQRKLVQTVVAAGKDKKARRAADDDIETARREKAKKAGRVLKMRALSDVQLSALGAKISEALVAKMTDLGLEAEADLEGWVAAGDSDLKTAYTFGILQGLKAAAGMAVNLVIE